MNEMFLTLADLAKMFCVSRSTVWRWHAERGLRVVTVGGVTRIRESDLQAFLERHESQPHDPQLAGNQGNHGLPV
jgi:excisionase family DNA binding protein